MSTTGSKRLTSAQWAEVVTKWELGTHTGAALAAEYGISERAIRKGLKDRGAVRGKRSAEVGEAAADAAKSDTQRRAEKAAQMREKFLSYNEALAGLTMRKIRDAVAGGKSLANIKDEIAVLRRAVATIGQIRDENFHLYGLYKEDLEDAELPEIIVGEYSADELEMIQKRFDEDEISAAIADIDGDDEPVEGEGELPFDDEEDAD
jgi:hypothetical protein